MYTYMEYLQKCFSKTTGWNEDNIYSNILATSSALLDFLIPNGGRLETSAQATVNLASSMTLLNHHTINGSLAYLYLGVRLTSTSGTKSISLQDAIAGFRIIEPHVGSTRGFSMTEGIKRASLVYGRMYFPGSALEAMIIKRLLSRYQLLVKCISNPHITKDGTMIVYFQENTPRFSREYIYSTNEALMGFRCLYNFGSSTKSQQLAALPKFDNSVVSVGTEVWYAAISMSPGLSTAFRYSTRSTSTGKPLTMTLSCNPILGHVSSTYNVKTSVSSTICSRYDFNWFSYASNLSIGFELFDFAKSSSNFPSTQFWQGTSIHHETLEPHQSANTRIASVDTTHLIAAKSREASFVNPLEHSHEQIFPKPNTSTRRSLTDLAGHEVISEFQNLVKRSNFASAIKGSTSLRDRMLKLLWIGRYKDFLVSTGIKLKLNTKMQAPEVERFGITFAYAC